MRTQIFEITEQTNQQTSMFGRGSEVLAMKIWKVISSKGEYECWYINDFEKRFKENSQKIRRALSDLVKRGCIKKIKAYPVFWERIEGGENERKN